MENIKIKELHESIAYGVLIETGCGLAVSSALLEVSGASNTVFFAECPYSKDFQEVKYGTSIKYGASTPRAVSKENLDRFIAYYEMDFKRAESKESLNKDAKKLNFIYAATFQIGEHNDISTHGWIGIWTPVGTRYYHVSIHESMSRKEYIEKISQIGIDLLHHCTVASGFGLKAVGAIIPSNCCIDIALTSNGEQVDIGEMIFSLRNETKDNFICVKDGKLVRMEELFRELK